MKKVTLFHFEGCPYCAAARRYMAQLLDEHPEYRALDIRLIDEKLHPETAGKYDYWYVPTFYLDEEKAHEGAVTKQTVDRVLREALDSDIRAAI